MSDALSYEELAALPARMMSMGLALSWQAARDPDRPALTMGETSYSRVELDRIVNRTARALTACGIEQDDRIVIVMPTGPMHQIVAQAGWKLGATVIPLPPKLVDVELAKLVEAADPKLVIGIDPARLPERQVLQTMLPLDGTLSDAPLPEVVATRWKAITSGGSTGMPKLLWDNLSSLVDPTRPLEVLSLRLDDVMLQPAGAYHNSPFSQTNWGLCWGIHVVIMERFDAVEWLKAVERHKVRWAYLVPTMMSRILAVPRDVRESFDLSSLDVIIHMAAPCPPWVKAAWIEWFGADKILEVYAGSEGYGTTILSGQEWLDHPGTVGKVPPHTEVRDEDGQVLPPGEIGTIFFSPPPGNILGLSADHRTYGDMGSMDADGYLYIADRRTDMIVSGGGNIYPAEIEAAIEQYPGVVAVAVVGLPHPDLGSVAHAIVEVAPQTRAPEPHQLAEFLRTRLAKTKFPRTYEVAAAPIRDEAGKMRRTRLREACLARTEPAYYRMP